MGVIKMKCSICEKEIEKKYHNGEMYWDSGHNAEPVNSGRCCDKCNANVVIPTRLGIHINRKNFEREHQ
tara:strand:- start:3516 stop:3722 length:207 start_codon:yes stop_codon:yes gene_type:complete